MTKADAQSLRPGDHVCAGYTIYRVRECGVQAVQEGWRREVVIVPVASLDGRAVRWLKPNQIKWRRAGADAPEKAA